MEDQNNQISPEELYSQIDEFIVQLNELNKTFENLMKSIKPIYSEINHKSTQLWDLNRQVKSRKLVAGWLHVDYLRDALEGILKTDKTPSYDSYDTYEKDFVITDNVKNNRGELPPEMSYWITPKNLAQKILDLMDEKSYDVPCEHWNYEKCKK